jgi:membrane associated rhomboid family serine protease
MLTPEYPPDHAIVFRGPRAVCLEFSLVLEAKSIPYEMLEQEPLYALVVTAEFENAARDELTRYAHERTIRREHAPPLAPFAGAAAGSIGYTLVLLLVAYCAGIGLFGADWLSVGALKQGLPGDHEGWRAVTALTLHLDQAHLLSNLLFGVGVGAVVSSMFGPGVGWASILAAGAFGNYLEMLISPPDHRAVGASTAVFAALGLLSGFGWRRQWTLRERWMYRWAPLIAGACLLTLLGVGTEHVDVLGHLLGFVSGVALGWIYARTGMPRSRHARVQWIAGGAAILVITIAWFTALRTT